VKIKVGDSVKEGSVILELEPADGASSAESTAAPVATPAPTANPASEPKVAAPSAAPAQTERKSAGTSGVRSLTVPDIGDFDEVEVIEILVAVGDTIEPEQSLITVESDKASMEIPASAGGVVKEVRVKVGDKVAKGTVIVVAEGQGGDAQPQQAAQPAS